jgi:hypothetical protein
LDRKFILKIEQHGRVSFQVVAGHRQALRLAHAFLGRNGDQRIEVLDATGRIVWEADSDTSN